MSHIMQGAIVEGNNVKIGSGGQVGYNSIVRNNARIGENVYISHLCCIADGTIIEDDVFIGPSVTLTNTRHICHGRDEIFTGERKPIVVRRGARIGAGATILPGVTIGEESEIGAGSVVTKDTLPYCQYIGVPAHFTKKVPKEEWLKKPEQ